MLIEHQASGKALNKLKNEKSCQKKRIEKLIRQ